MAIVRFWGETNLGELPHGYMPGNKQIQTNKLVGFRDHRQSAYRLREQ